MNTTIKPAKQSSLPTIILGILAALLVVAVLAQIQLPLISDTRLAFVVLSILGMAMCTSGGIGRALQVHGWRHPVTIAGSILGVLAILLFAAVLLNIPLPLIATDREAIIAMASLGTLKVVISFLI